MNPPGVSPAEVALFFVTEANEIVLDGTRVSYRVRTSTRARRPQMRFRADGELEVVLPRSVRGLDPESILREHVTWVVENTRRRDSIAAAMPRPDIRIGGSYPLFGRPCPIRAGNTAAPSRARYANASIAIDGVRLGASDLSRLIEGLAASIASEVTASRASHWCRIVGVSARGVRVGAYRSRWGACSTDRELTFDWRLVLAPPPILDHVVLHEVIHLVHFSHGVEFRRLLGRFDPRWKVHERWLDERGFALRSSVPRARDGHDDLREGSRDR